MFGVADTNKKFHELIYEAANNKTLTRLIESLNMVLLRDMKFSASDENRKREIINEHKDIITALKYKNIEEAKKAMRRHILNGKEYIEKRKG